MVKDQINTKDLMLVEIESLSSYDAYALVMETEDALALVKLLRNAKTMRRKYDSGVNDIVDTSEPVCVEAKTYSHTKFAAAVLNHSKYGEDNNG